MFYLLIASTSSPKTRATNRSSNLNLLFYFILTTVLQCQNYYSHFRYEEIVAQRSYLTCSRSSVSCRARIQSRSVSFQSSCSFRLNGSSIAHTCIPNTSQVLRILQHLCLSAQGILFMKGPQVT